MINKLKLVELPARMSGLRHGGTRLERIFKFYVNDHLWSEWREGAANPFNYATGGYFTAAINREVERFEKVLDAACDRIDATKPSKPEPSAATVEKVRCDHDWRATDNWLIDRCAKCGEERA